MMTGPAIPLDEAMYSTIAHACAIVGIVVIKDAIIIKDAIVTIGL